MWQRTLSLGGLLCFSLAWASTALASGQIRTSRGSEFLIKKWTTEDGLPQNSVTSIVQTRDGYIWLGTFGGLARFDGVKFTVFDSTSSPVLRSNRVLSLYEDGWARLWVGAENGDIYILENGHFRLFSSGESGRGTVWALITDNNHHLFVSADAGLERYSLDETGGIIPESRAQLSTERTFGLFRHPNGSIWVRIQGLIYKVDNDHLVLDSQTYPITKDDVLKIDFAADGAMVIGAWSSFSIAGRGKFENILRLDAGIHRAGLAVRANQGASWLQQSNELYELKDSVLTKYDLSGIVRSGSRAMLFDSEGNLWLATQEDGLVKLTRRTIGLFSDVMGEQLTNVYTLLSGKQDLWVGGLKLLKIRDGKVTSFSRRRDGGPFPVVRALAIDRDNALWVGGTVGLFKLENDQLVSIGGFEHRQVYALFFDSRADLWIGGSEGLWRYSNGAVTHFDTTSGLVNDDVHRITETRDGTIWVGTAGGISRFKEGHWDRLTSDNGLSGSYVREILEDKDGTIWIGTYGGGLSRFRNGTLTSITRANGLPNNFISRVLIGEDGRFWMLTNLGVFAVAREELNRIADGGMGPLIGSLYGVADGMPSSEANGGNQYAGTKASDGKLWFPMLRDVVIIDPNRVSRIPPRVFIERASSLTADNQNTSAAQADLLAGVTIANDARNLQIEYTGLSFSKPAAIRFLYKLDGLDHDWTDAGDRRTAFYPYLPAGNYTFLVRVVSGDGVWSESAAGLRIKVAARFWETVTFRILVALGLVAIGALIYRLRVRQLEAHHERQRDFARRLIDAHETERMRLAKDLHDGLGQQLLLIKNFASLGLSRKSVAGSSDSYFEKISGAASDSIEETRAIVNELGPQNLRRFGLTEAIANMAHDVEAASGVTFEKHIANIDDLLSQESELSVFRVVQECLNNVVKHSQSSRAQINVNQVGRRIKIAVRDFGAGFSTDDVLGRRTGRAGFGFQSISERVDLLGGKVDITSKPGQGTCVAIEIAIENAEPNHSPGS